MNKIIKFIPRGSACDTNELFKQGQPTIVTIHWVGPYPGQTPDIVRDYWISSGGEASAHFIIKDDDCMQCWPINKVAWHAGCTQGNSNSIGIEVIPMNTDGEFSEASIKTLKELLTEFKRWPVVRHFDWTGKDCPKYYMDNNRWNDLLSKIISV